MLINHLKTTFTFTFMHVADTFIQRDLLYIQVIHFSQYVCSLRIEPTTHIKTRRTVIAHLISLSEITAN